MTATNAPHQSHLPLPAGAVEVNEWDKQSTRYFEHAPVDIGDAVLTIRGVQYPDGSTGRSILLRLDESIQTQADDLTPLYARRLAAMLYNFADTCEILDGVQR